MSPIRNSSNLVVLALMLLLVVSGCKSGKKAMEASKAKEKARMEQEAALRKQQEAEAKSKAEAEERERKAAEARLKESETKEVVPKIKLTEYFEVIARSGTATAANNSINEALGLFASPDTPVLIVISEEEGQKDYDRPTTIKEYLHYLKDQKKNINTISNLKLDGSGKITEVELRKSL